MPSSEIVEIDAADNDVAILDASACALAVSSSSSSSSSSSDVVSAAISPRVSQSQEDHRRGEEDEDEEEGGGKGEADEEVGDVDAGGREGADDGRRRGRRRPAQVSPVPRKKASVVTPRPARIRTKAGTKSSSSSSSTRGGSGGGGRGRGGKTSPTSPSASSQTSSSSTVLVAVATPGGEDDGPTATTTTSTSTRGKKDPAKKPSTTLHSFFARVDPSSALTSARVEGKDSRRGVVFARGKLPTIDKEGGGSSGSVVAITKTIEAATTESLSTAVKATKDDEDAIDKVEDAVEGMPTAPSKDTTPNDKSSDGTKDDHDAVEGVKGTTAKAGLTAARRRHAPQLPRSSSSLSCIVGKTGGEEELDDSPMYAVAVASRTIGGAGGSRRRGSSSGNNSGVLIRQWDEKYDLLVRYKQTHGDCAIPSSYKTTAAEGGNGGEGREGTTIFLGRWLENQKASHKRGKLLPERYARLRTIGVDFGKEAPESNENDVRGDPNSIDDTIDPAPAAVDAVETNECVAVGGMSMMGANNDRDANEHSDYFITDIDCDEGKDNVPEKTDKMREDDDDDDATVAFEEDGAASREYNVADHDDRVDEDSHVPSEIDQQPTTSEDLLDNQKIPIEDMQAVSVSNVFGKSASKEPPIETSVISSSNTEVEDVASSKQKATSSTRQTKTTTKLPEKSLKKATSSRRKSLKGNSSLAAMDIKGVTPIAAPLKKLAAGPQKRVCKSKTQEYPSPTVSVSSGSINDAVSTNNLADAKQDDAISSTTSNIVNLSEEDVSRLRDLKTLRAKYVSRAVELSNLPSSDDYEEEHLSLDGCTADKGSIEVAEDGGFPDKLLTHLQLLVQGRSQPLSVLAKSALEELSPFITDVRPLTFESISSKIKLLAQRKSYLSGKAHEFEKVNPVARLDCFENAEECFMWRWELSSIDLLPQREATKVKRARMMRRKLQSHHKSIINLITAIDKASLSLQNSGSISLSTSAPTGGESLTARVSEMEEKVLKFEREEEKARLLRETKMQNKDKTEDLAEKQRQEEEKRNEKLRQEEERRYEKKRKEEEKELKKAEAMRLKNEDIEKKRHELEEKENKRKARMMSFFSTGTVKKKAKVLNTSVLSNAAQADIHLFDSDAFRNLIDSQDTHVVTNPFVKLSPRSKACRRWKTNKVRVTVFVTVLSENAFAPQPYDEERVIIVPNRYKFLGFHEDVRPPYRGTWSKRSSLVTGRRPLGKDTKYLDYDVDSEEEWEEGDDEEGEDLVDDDDGAEEEEDMQNDEDNDGWLADEDDLGIEDDDDETRELRKKNILNETNGLSGKPRHFKACVVAPRIGGLPHESFEDDDMQYVIEGFSPKEAMDVLISHAGCVITPDVSICLDAFPPSDSIKDPSQIKKDTSGKPSTPQIKDLTPEAQKIMAHFVHNSTLKSKDYVVSELLKAHPTITTSRAQAMRELDVIADKRRLSNGSGVLWEVKNDHLKKLGLKEDDLKKAPEEVPLPSKLSEGVDKTKKKKDPNAPKQCMSAFILFCNAARADFRAENPDLAFGDLAKLLSAKFKSLTAEERAEWDEKAVTDKARYHMEMAEYSSKVASSESKATVTSCSPKPSESHVTKLSSAKKRKHVSTASANLLAAFISQKKKQK